MGADVALAQVVDAVDDRRAGRARDPVVVRLADPPDRGNVGLDEVVLREVWWWKLLRVRRADP